MSKPRPIKETRLVSVLVDQQIRLQEKYGEDRENIQPSQKNKYPASRATTLGEKSRNMHADGIFLWVRALRVPGEYRHRRLPCTVVIERRQAGRHYSSLGTANHFQQRVQELYCGQWLRPKLVGRVRHGTAQYFPAADSCKNRH